MTKSTATSTTTKTNGIHLGPKATPQMPKPAAAPIKEDELTLKQMLADMGFHMPSWKRNLVAGVASFLSGYVIGATFSALFELMFGAALLASGWTFMLVVAYVIGLVIAIYAAIKVSTRMYGYIASGSVDQDASRAWGWVKAKCSFSNPGLKTV